MATSSPKGSNTPSQTVAWLTSVSFWGEPKWSAWT